MLSITIKVKIAKMGNSIRMTIPIPVVEALGLKSGDTLEVGVTDGALIARKVGGG